jgi:hypothetical protein
MWEAVFSVGSVLKLYHGDQQEKPVSLGKSRGVSVQLAAGRQTRRRLSQTVAPGGVPIVVSRCVATPISCETIAAQQ